MPTRSSTEPFYDEAKNFPKEICFERKLEYIKR